MSIWPPSSAAEEGPLPRNGTWVICTPARLAKASAGMCEEPPTPLDPKVRLPGSALASAMNSPRFLAGTFGLITITSGNLVTSVIGMKSLIGS